MTVYLIHFDAKLCHAQHYLGSADNVEARLECHRKGNGARLMEVITEHGIPWRLARTWPGDRKLERELKRQKGSPRLCPICNPNANHRKPTRKERAP